MTKKTFTIIMAILLLVSFFLPWEKSNNRSGLDIMLQGKSYVRFFMLVFPISALVLLGWAFGKGKYEKGLFHWLPFIAIVLAGFFAKQLELTPNYAEKDLGIGASFINAFIGSTWGFWITGAVAILLLFGNAIATKPNK